MLQIFEVLDKGQDGTDGSVIGYCSEGELAGRLSRGRGAMGVGDGDVKKIEVWETEDDLPMNVRQRVREEEIRARRAALEEIRSKAEELKRLLDDVSPEDRRSVREMLSTEPDFEDDIPR